jgi:putative nucleotidyltransferase with HDIG domain
MDNNLEEKLKIEVFKYLEKGRPNWDLPHTLAVVHWMKELLKGEGGNSRVLITAAYLHDIGYANMFDESNYDDDSVMVMRSKHMQIGVEYSRNILDKVKGFEKEEIERIFHLVGMHDDLEQIVDNDEQILFEADSLGQIDIERVKSNWNDEDYKKFINHYQRDRAIRFKTKTGIKFRDILLEKILKDRKI